MRARMVFTVIFLLVGVLFAQKQITAVITDVTDENNGKFVLLTVDDQSVQLKVASLLGSDAGVQCYAQRDVSGMPTGPILIPKKAGNFIRHEKMGRDLAVGASLCLAGCLFVQVAGTEKSTMAQPDGFYAMAGTKVVTGGPACVVGAMWATGCLFLSKGVIEIFSGRRDRYEEPEEPRSQLFSPERSLIGRIDPSPGKSAAAHGTRSAEEIIATHGYRIENRLEKNVTIDNVGDLENWIMRYCLSM